MNDVAAFCNRITPANWNVAVDPDKFAFNGPGMLNIILVRIDHFVDGWCYALKKGRMEMAPVSAYAGCHAGARRALRLYGDHMVGKSEIWLYPEGCVFYGDNLFAAAVHEMAHVAVDRLRIRSGKIQRNQTSSRIPKNDLHGETFCRALGALIRRAAVLDGDQTGILRLLRRELCQYRMSRAEDTHEIARGWLTMAW